MKNKNVKNTDKTSSPVQKQLAFLFSLHCSHDSETQNMALIFFSFSNLIIIIIIIVIIMMIINFTVFLPLGRLLVS